MPTAEELQAAVTAAAQNQQTAEQAAMLNAAYRTNQLPVTPQYAPTAANTDYSAASQQQRAAAYSQEGNNLIVVYDGGSATERGTAVYLTPQEYQQKFGYTDAQYEAAKYAVFNNPGSVDPAKIPVSLRETYSQQLNQSVHEYYMANPSPEFLAINKQYAEQQNRVIGGDGSVMYQGTSRQTQNPFDPNSAIGIAWEVGRTGGATDFNMNLIAEQEGKAMGADTSFIRYATDVYVERPAFDREVLTTRTGQQFVNEAWGGVPIRLNLTKAEMAAGGGMSEDNINKFFRYNQDTYLLDKVKSPDEGFGVDPGVHKAFGDFGGPILEGGTYGGWSRGGVITGGGGGGGVAAVGGVPGAPPMPFLSTSSGLVRVDKPTGEIFGMYIPGISEGVAFFEPKSAIYASEKRTSMAPVTTFGEPYTEGDTTYYPSTTTSGDIITKTETPVPIAGSSGYDTFNEGIRNALHLPDAATGERAVKLASYANFFTGPGLIAGDITKAAAEGIFGKESIVAKNVAEGAEFRYATAPGSMKGQYESFYEQPALAVGSYAVGFAFKGVTSVGGAVRSRIAPAVISRGETARALEITGSRIWNVAQVGMAGLYATDVSSRATQGFTEFSPTVVVPRLRASVTQEVYPMMLGYNAPGQIYKAAKVSNLNYQQALMAGKGEPAGRIKLSVEGEPRSATVGKYLELNKWNLDTSGVSLGAKPTYRAAPDTGSMKGIGWGVSEKTTTGRFDWYVKQPVAEAVSRPVRSIRNDYLGFVQEASAKTPVVQLKQPGVPEYVSSKLGIGEYSRPIQPEPLTLREPTIIKGGEPISYEPPSSLSRTAYGKQRTLPELVGDRLGAGITPKAEVPFLQTSQSTVYQGGQWSKVIREPVGDVSPDLSMKAYPQQKPAYNYATTVVQESHQYARYISERTANTLSNMYSSMPINLRARAFIQERVSPRVDDFRLAAYYPETEVANINRASRVRLGEMFKGTTTPKGTSTLNIWGKTPMEFIGSKTPYPDVSKPVETKTPGGTLLSRVEMEPRGVPSFQPQESIRALPVYPRGPSPVQRTSNVVITEEEQYYRLPPGMKSPGPTRETIQGIVAIPALSSASITDSMLKQSFALRQDSAIRSEFAVRSEQVSRSRQDIVQQSRQDSIFTTRPRFSILQDNYIRTDLASRPRQDIITISEPAFDITQTPRQDTRQTTRQTPDLTQITRTIETPPPPPPPPPPIEGGGGWGFPGGGGSGYRGNLGAIRWKRNNLVADQPYLSRGMKDIGFGWGAGSGSFSMAKPRKSKSRRKKK